mmetsp:Transcript_16658/g.22953  ORF Transcript_16658/g.22953 Transcript_16658/m.22953 type:complete len:270 (+) Transcript_16658:76-885(+)|eukprot:CAMPEP_0196590252 /NCGR_PEP_ID=MMETSP1081-20130531/66130_1 /TAXON_ID=36882 /ORGANISM="Pyramimonas amylifera, Strain CCMP720" /LENGTH=269 /DNA_ID=CAMNT_0041913313 /DNA_START=73 /DNA_END=882 /DNA_ORIENTATION=-
MTVVYFFIVLLAVASIGLLIVYKPGLIESAQIFMYATPLNKRNLEQNSNDIETHVKRDLTDRHLMRNFDTNGSLHVIGEKLFTSLLISARAHKHKRSPGQASYDLHHREESSSGIGGKSGEESSVLVKSFLRGEIQRPHRHTFPETFVLLSGALAFLLYDNDGSLHSCHTLQPSSAMVGMDVHAGSWHSVTAMKDAIFLQVKGDSSSNQHRTTQTIWAADHWPVLGSTASHQGYQSVTRQLAIAQMQMRACGEHYSLGTMVTNTTGHHR